MKADVKQIDDLLSQLDEFAREYDSYDYGLPIHFKDTDNKLNDLRLIIKNWLDNIKES